jgi:anaerobic selenocysteine-containing dehydrogenase
MPVTRRDLLFGLGGGVAGAALTPVPWKLLDDISIWTQHRRGLPVPPRGPVTWKAAACTLCPAGCALRVRCVGARPVSSVGVSGHPLGGGACALGLTVHHLAYHPLRLTGPVRRVGDRLEPVAVDVAVAWIAEAMGEAVRAGQAVMVLDRRPGRVVSTGWRELLAALPSGVYACPPSEGATLAALGEAITPASPLGIDLERTGTLVSFGAPVLDGWGRPGRMLAVRRRLRVVQVDAWRSPSAALADEWVALRPGGEGPMALALAAVIVGDEPARASEAMRTTLAAFAPNLVAERVGVEAARIEALARSLVAQGPAVAVGGGDPGSGPLGVDAERAIALLDLVLGSVGVPGGIVARRSVPEASHEAPGAVASLAEVPAGSVRVVLLDAADDGRALPWAALARTLVPGALVVSLSPFESGFARQAALLLPGPAPLEAPDEVLPSADAAVASYGLAPALRPPPAGATDAITLIQKLAAALGVSVPLASLEERLRQRAAAVQACGRGRFVARSETQWTDAAVASPESAWETLAQGGTWIDDAAPAPNVSRPPRPPSAGALGRWAAVEPPTEGLALVAFASRGTAGVTPVSPLMTKLYQESDLRPSTTVATMSPGTALALGIGDRRRVRIESAAGAVLAELRHDATLPDGRLALAAGPDRSEMHPEVSPGASGAIPLVATGPDGTWRGTRVRVREA